MSLPSIVLDWNGSSRCLSIAGRDRRIKMFKTLFSKCISNLWLIVGQVVWGTISQPCLFETLSQEEIKYITEDRDTKVKSAFLKLKRSDFDAMEKHYEKVKEKEDEIPPFAKKPLSTMIVLWIAYFFFKSLFEWYDTIKWQILARHFI